MVGMFEDSTQPKEWASRRAYVLAVEMFQFLTHSG
jgi:hypothetical protein